MLLPICSSAKAIMALNQSDTLPPSTQTPAYTQNLHMHTPLPTMKPCALACISVCQCTHAEAHRRCVPQQPLLLTCTSASPAMAFPATKPAHRQHTNTPAPLHCPAPHLQQCWHQCQAHHGPPPCTPHVATQHIKASEAALVGDASTVSCQNAKVDAHLAAAAGRGRRGGGTQRQLGKNSCWGVEGR
jgi:hypothetical protein